MLDIEERKKLMARAKHPSYLHFIQNHLVVFK